MDEKIIEEMRRHVTHLARHNMTKSAQERGIVPSQTQEAIMQTEESRHEKL